MRNDLTVLEQGEHLARRQAQLLVALERFFTNISQSEPIEAIDEELREYGYDPKALGSQIEVLANRALANSQLKMPAGHSINSKQIN